MWAYLTQNLTLSELADLFSVSERTIRHYVQLFYQTGDVQPSDGGKHGPQKLLGDHEQLILLGMILSSLVFTYTRYRQASMRRLVSSSACIPYAGHFSICVAQGRPCIM